MSPAGTRATCAVLCFCSDRFRLGIGSGGSPSLSRRCRRSGSRRWSFSGRGTMMSVLSSSTTPAKCRPLLSDPERTQPRVRSPSAGVTSRCARAKSCASLRRPVQTSRRQCSGRSSQQASAAEAHGVSDGAPHARPGCSSVATRFAQAGRDWEAGAADGNLPPQRPVALQRNEMGAHRGESVARGASRSVAEIQRPSRARATPRYTRPAGIHMITPASCWSARGSRFHACVVDS